MNLNISTSNIQNDKNFSTSIQPSFSENRQKSHDSSAQKQLIASCMGEDEPAFNKYPNSKTYSNVTHKKQIVTDALVKPEKPIQHSKQIHASNSANVQSRRYNGTNTVKSTFNKYSNLKRYVLSKKKLISSPQHSKHIHTPSSATVLSRPCNGTNIVDPIFNEHSNPKKYSNFVNTQMITNLHSSLKKPVLCRSHCKEIHTSNSAAIPNTACNESNIIEPTFNKHSDPKMHSNIIPNKQLTTNLPFLPKESISSLQHVKQIHLTNSVANQNESSCTKTVDVKVLRSSAVFDSKNTNSDKIKTDESSLTELSSFSLNSLQRNDKSISRICNTSDIPNDSKNSSGLLKRQITRVSDSNLNCTILPLKENKTKTDAIPNSSNVPQVEDDFIKPNNAYKTVVSINEKKNSQDDKVQITSASQTNLKCMKLYLKENNKKTDTILHTNNEPQVQDDFIRPYNSYQCLVGINKTKNSQDDKRQTTSPSQTNLKFTRLSLEENNTKTDAISNKNNVLQVLDDFIKPNNSCQAIVSISEQKNFQDATDIPKKVLCAKKSISSSENILFNSSCNSSSKTASLDKTFEKSRKYHRNHQSQNRHSVEKIKRCSSESVSLPVLHPTIIHLLKNNKETLTIMPVENVKAEYEKDNTLKGIPLSPSSQKNSCSLQITLKKHAVEEHSKTDCHDSVTDISDSKNSINDSAEASKNIHFLNPSISPIIFNFDKKPELYEKISKYVSSAVSESKPSEPEVSDNLLHTNKPPRIIRQNIVYTDDREAILRLSTLHEPQDDSETKKSTLKNAKPAGISTFCDNESSVIPENTKKSNISSEFTIKLEEVHNKNRYWPKPVIASETIGAFDKYNVSLSKLVTKKNNLSTSTNEPLTKSKIARITKRKEKFPLSQNFKEIPEKNASHYKILTNVSNAFNTQNSDKNKSNVNLNHTSLSNSKPVSISASNPPSVSTAKMMKNIISCPEKTQTIKNSSEKLPPSLLNSLRKNGISLSSLQKCGISVTNVGNDSKYNSEVFNINSNASQNNLKNEEFSVKDNHAKANKANQEKNISQIKINCTESNNVSRAIGINHIYTRIPYKRKIPATDADANILNKSVCVRKSSSSSESMLLNKSNNSISKFAPIEKTSEESRNKKYDKLVTSPTQNLFSQNQYKIKEIREWSIKSVPPAALLHTKAVSLVKNSQEPVSSISVQNIMVVNQKFAILKRYLLSNSEKKMFSSRIPSTNTINSPKIKADDSITNFNVTFDIAGTSDNTPSLDAPLLTTVMNPVNDSDLHKKVHKKDSSALIETKPSLSKISYNLSLGNQPAGASKKNIVDFTHDREAPLRMRSMCDPKYRAENTEAKLKNAKQIGISTLCQKQSFVIPEKKENISLEITIKIKDVNKNIGPLERTSVFKEHIITNSYLSKPVPEKIDFTTASKNESLFKVEISKLDEKEKEKCFSPSHNLNEIPENSLSRCINNEVTSSDCVNGVNEKVNSKPTENIPPISANMLNDTSLVETIQTNVDNFVVSKTNKIFGDFNKSEALQTIKSLQASTTSIVETNDEMISSIYVTENKNTTLPHIENKNVRSSADNIYTADSTISSENELRNVNSEENLDLQLLHLLLTEVQNTYGKVFLKNFIENCVKSSEWGNKNDTNKLDKSSYTSDFGEQGTLNQELVLKNQVTSPKLSLKRNRTELTPDRKLDERPGVENVSKKIKFNDTVLGTELSNKKPETAISTDTTPTVSVDVAPSTSFASTTPVIELSDEEPAILIVDEEKEFQMISSMNSDAPICNILEERRKKLIRILDFAAPVMPPDTSDEEKKIIASRLLKQLDTAQQSYVESENFNFLLDISFEKIKMKPEGVFTFLNEIKRELKNHKKEKKAIKGSTEDNKISLTDDSISKDIFIDSTSSLPSKDKVALGDALHTNFNFASRLKEYFKVPEKQEPDSASCSSLTSESTKFFSSNKNIINDSGSNLQTAANSNTKVVSDNLVTDESSSSIIALGWHSVKLNTSKSQSLYNQMSKKFKSAEDNSTSLSKIAIPESASFPVTLFPVSGNDHENKKVDLSKQSNRRKSIDDSGSNLQTSINSDKKLVSDNSVTHEFSSSAIASAVGLCSKELKTSKDLSKEKLNSTEVAHDASTSGMHLSSTSIPEHGVSRNNVNKEFDLSSLPSTSRCRSPSDKFLLKNDNSSKMSHSSSTDSLSADRRTGLEKKEDDRNAKRIKKLEKLLKELDRAIKKCQQEDLSLDDMDNADSAYLQESRYKKRFVATYKLLCKLKKVPARTGRIIEKKFRYQGSRYSVINKAIEKLIDSKKIHEKFPDYNEVLNVIKQVQDRDDLGFTETDISNEAKRVFEDIGEQLKERRWRDQRELMGCYLTDDLDLDEDPAERDDRLRKTLEENSKKFNESINQIIDHYVEKQQQTPAGENDDEEDDAEEDDEKDDDEEETVANIHDDSDDLPGTAPASPENIGGASVINIIERDDDDIEIINYSDKSTDPEGEIKEKQTLTVNKPDISQSIVLDDSESSEDLPSLQELVDKSKIGS